MLGDVGDVVFGRKDVLDIFRNRESPESSVVQSNAKRYNLPDSLFQFVIRTDLVHWKIHCTSNKQMLVLYEGWYTSSSNSRNITYIITRRQKLVGVSLGGLVVLIITFQMVVPCCNWMVPNKKFENRNPYEPMWRPGTHLLVWIYSIYSSQQKALGILGCYQFNDFFLQILVLGGLGVT